MRSLKSLLGLSPIIATAILITCPAVMRGQTRESKSKATGSISGHVLLNGKAAAGIAVAAYGGDTMSRRVAAARTVTDSEGYYSLSQLAPAQYQIATLTPNLTAAETASGPPYGFAYFGSSKNVILAAGEMVGEIDIKLVRGGVITGRVTEGESKPAIEERVALLLVDQNGNPARGGSPLPYNGQMYQTDDRGVYRIYGLPAGHYKVSVGSDAGGGIVSGGRRRYYPRTFYPDVSDQAKAAVVELNEGQEATNIDIKVGSSAESYSASGRVIDSDSGLPVAGARIGFLLNPNNSQERSGSFYGGLSTDSRGEFKLEGLGPGRYGAYIATDYDVGGDAYSDPAYFEVIDKDVSGIEIKAIHGLTLSGVVVAEGDVRKAVQLPGLRISANSIQASRNQFNSGATSPVAADGSFQVNGLRPGRISVGVYASGPSQIRPTIARIEHDGIGLPQGFEMQPGQSVSGLRIVISYGTGTIRGTVRFEGGSLPIDSRAYISFKREGSSAGLSAQLDSRGHFIISDLAPGTYEVTLQISVSRISPSRPGPPQKQSVSVSNDAEAEVTFVVDLRPKEGGP
jgi:hypothetical protein